MKICVILEVEPLNQTYLTALEKERIIDQVKKSVGSGAIAQEGSDRALYYTTKTRVIFTEPQT